MGSFEDRFVGFVDILGFRDIVGRLQDDSALFETVRDALVAIDNRAKQLESYRRLCTEPVSSHRVSSLSPNDVRMTAFSDCYLISDSASEDSSPWLLMAAVQALASHLLAKGVLTRGALVRGKAYHDDRVSFGPAIIEAYEIEQTVAHFPRIVVTDPVRTAISWENETFWNGEMLHQDSDGLWFLNALIPPLSKAESTLTNTSSMDTVEFLTSLRSVLAEKIESSRAKVRHLSKVGWLVSYFNIAARKHGIPILDNIAQDPSD